ncbi:glycosyltransferase involved in cell wall biosynthesis [Rhizobium aquaticum]|uniref:Glycosyltransferase involved in cell wall biosynthesis n=1 Tax=Rhizobium aquaticum TaxID=1549636 RepID=A0ABV2J2U9_9HYPH
MDHYARRLRSKTTAEYRIDQNYRIIVLEGRLYSRSISYSRFMNHRDVAKAFRTMAPNLEKPDVVLSSYPTEELCRAILDYCEPRNIPVAIDVRDFWPDIFSELLPEPFRFTGDLIFSPFRHAARSTVRRAAALSGMTQSALNWALSLAGRQQSNADFWFPFSYKAQQRGGAQEHDGVRLCFIGTLSHRSNLEIVVDAMRLLSGRNVKAHLDICGTGEASDSLKARASGLTNVTFHGWLSASELSDIMKASDLGVLPYDRPDFHLSIPNKFVEYLAGGLGVLSCTEGEVHRLIDERDCGVWVEPSATNIAAVVSQVGTERLTGIRRNAAELFANTFEEDRVFQRALNGLENLVISKDASER